MAYKVFVSYSTNDFPIVDHVQSLLASPEVDVFVADYSVSPSEPLGETILQALRSCDLFILLWSRNSKASEWVSQEIGVAIDQNKTILPIVLEDGLKLPGFISNLKYLPAYRKPEESYLWLKQNILSHAQKQQQTKTLVIFGLAVAFLWLINQK